MFFARFNVFLVTYFVVLAVCLVRNKIAIFGWWKLLSIEKEVQAIIIFNDVEVNI